jgi:hypothetical protein
MSRISHHASWRGPALMTTVGALMPVSDGRGAAPDVLDAVGTRTMSERQTPRPATTVVLLVHFASTHVPA